MTVLAWVLLVPLVIAGIVFTAMPIVRGRKGPSRTPGASSASEELAAALREKESALQLLRDLEHDRRTGKIEAEDYDALRAEAEARAIEAMKRCDDLGGAAGRDPVEESIRMERMRMIKGAGR